jgi:RNA polymerase sigma-70 factor (ECF subfamily)
VRVSNDLCVGFSLSTVRCQPTNRFVRVFSDRYTEPPPHGAAPLDQVEAMDIDNAKVERGRTVARFEYASPGDLFQAHYLRLASALAVWSGDREAAADAVQEAFVELVRRWDRIGSYDDPVGWVRRVSVNRLRSHHRGLASRAAALIRLAQRGESVSTGAAPASELAEALCRLPQRQRLAMSLFYVADLSTAEVAQAMGVSEGSVKQHLHRGREAVRRLLEEP